MTIVAVMPVIPVVPGMMMVIVMTVASIPVVIMSPVMAVTRLDIHISERRIQVAPDSCAAIGRAVRQGKQPDDDAENGEAAVHF
jgi:hypothetical protein